MSNSKPERPVRWGTMIPLIGGSALGCAKTTGNLPLFHLSYTPFAANESHLHRYWPNIPTFQLDKTTFPVEKILAEGDIDFINSVCPCAGLSMLNTVTKGASGRGSDAVQNQWMIKSARFVLENVKPKVLWGENAPGLFLSLGEDMVPKLKSLGMEYGYSFSMVKTNTQLHGLPQMRMRTFYFFWRSPTVPMLRYIVKQAPHLIEYLRDIPPWATFQDQFVAEGKVTDRFKPYMYVLLRENMTHQQFSKKMADSFGTITISRYLEKYNLIDDCIEWLKMYFPNHKWSVKNNSKSRTHIQYLTHMKDKLSRGLGYWDDSPKFMGDHFTAVITKNVVYAVHPVEDRFLNIREIMHLMGLPHDFQIDDPKNWNHVCQNVPLNTASDWAAEVLRFCRGEAEMTNFSFLKQDNCSQRIVEKEFTKIKTEIKVEQEEALADFEPPQFKLDEQDQTEIKMEQDETYTQFEAPELKIEDLHYMIKGNEGFDIKEEKDYTEQKIEIKTESEILVEQQGNLIPVKIEVKDEHFSQGVEMQNFLNFKDLQPETQTLPVQTYDTSVIKPNPMKVTNRSSRSRVELTSEDKSSSIQKSAPTNSGTVYQCGMCKQARFWTKPELSYHFNSCKSPVQSSKSELTVFKCGLCKYMVKEKKHMNEHWINDCTKMFNSSKRIRGF